MLFTLNINDRVPEQGDKGLASLSDTLVTRGESRLAKVRQARTYARTTHTRETERGEVGTPSVLDLRLNRFVWSAAGTAGACKSGHPFVKFKDSWLQRPRLLPLPTPYVSSPNHPRLHPFTEDPACRQAPWRPLLLIINNPSLPPPPTHSTTPPWTPPTHHHNTSKWKTFRAARRPHPHHSTAAAHQHRPRHLHS